MGMHDKYHDADIHYDTDRYTDTMHDYPSPEMDGVSATSTGLVTDWLEVFDYVGGNRFRGFVAEQDGEKTMFVFFDQSVIGGDLKPGLMALLELCDLSYFSCSRLVTCLDRHTESRAMDALVKDLGWIGFQLTTLDDWTRSDLITSGRWFFMDMDV